MEYIKPSLLWLSFLLAVSVGVSAQTSETFDIATFQIPGGWTRQAKPGVLILTTSDAGKGTFAMITLYQSATSSGNAAKDFDADWQQFVVGQFGIKGKAEMQPVKRADGWEIVMGGTGFENEQGPALVVLNTISGFGRAFSVVAIFNSQDKIPAIEAFLASISLQKPAGPVSQDPPVNADSGASLLGTWGAATSVAYRTGTEGSAGYIRSQYTFNADGSYSFTSKTFRYSLDKLLLIRESGTYQVSGNGITLSPKKSVIEAWSKRDGTDKWGRLITTQGRTLERVTYRFTKHYFSGIQVWNLVLQADKPTERDGPFSNNTTFNNAWYYAPISSSNPVIELPN